MQRIFFFIFLVTLVACDDGDFVIERLVFENSEIAPACGELTLYKIAENGTEALIIELNASADIFTTTENDVDTLTFNINNNANKVIYRIFDDEVSSSYFCNDIPPTAPLVIEEWTAPSGTIQIVTTTREDDNDGIPAEEEGIVYAEDGTIDKAGSQDSDGDGIPDYIDRDDDDDNVFTIDEYDVVDGANVYTDTDGDSTPDYLDNDDDGDGTLTIDEDLDGDGNPANDVQVGNNEPNYLISSLTEQTTNVFGRKKNEYQRLYSSTIKIIDGFQLENGNQEIKYDVPEYLFGEIENTEAISE
ncbi:hypothetical protein OOZ15_10085 [Galbibacter sp. EGI 63066]|uniref:hypothetical protein n=1 Tax=Galbibacter sp. EGI 63066 TaxID=2993559 RepID=UPI0022492FDC|nr:hypothetical protein [Galbibacter sp. EGI 63066]MCX2680288.1 hypothetical protein [Galbibacter sp. EGI 63066]